MDTPVRFITDHIINPANDKLTVTVTDAPGPERPGVYDYRMMAGVRP